MRFLACRKNLEANLQRAIGDAEDATGDRPVGSEVAAVVVVAASALPWWPRRITGRHHEQALHDRGNDDQVKAEADDVTAGDGDMVPAACPHVSPLCPHATEPKKPNEINVSPVSPRVPSFLTQVAADDDFEHEALKKRAAIMEFDGGVHAAAGRTGLHG